MKRRKTLENLIDATRVEHLRFKATAERIADRLDQALAGRESRFQAIAGPSRVGKTAIVKALMARYPETKLNNERRVPVLFVGSMDSPSPTALPMSVLSALGVKPPRSARNVGSLTDFMHEQLDLVENRVLFFDEFSQLVERGSRVTPDEAARWCKTVILKGRSVFAAGVPRVELLLEADPQLVGRAYRTIKFDPYRPDDQKELSAFISVGLAYLALLDEQGWTVREDDQQAILCNMYLHAPGLGGGVRDLMYELARQLNGKAPRELALEDFAAASSALEPLGPGSPLPCSSCDVTRTDLNQAYLHVVARNSPKAKRNSR
jgi:hypothetical protein